VGQAREHGLWVCGSAPEVQPGDDLPANTLILAAPDGALTRYAKIHPFTYGGEHEKYAAGSTHVTVEIEGVRCSLFVCYDLRFADEFWALAPTTDCYIVVANWPAPRRDHWRTLLRAVPSRTRRTWSASIESGAAGGWSTPATTVIGPLGDVMWKPKAARARRCWWPRSTPRSR
jgi:hypothetical protein